MSEIKPNGVPGFIEEYKEIRAEIRHYLDRRSKNTQFTFIITAAVVGVPAELRSSLLFLVASMIIIFIWYDEIRRIFAVFRLAAYLEVVVEPNVEGFNWETLSGLHPIQLNLFDKVLANGVYPLTFLILSGTATYLFSWGLFLKILLATGYAIIFLFLIIKSYKTIKGGRIREVNVWKNIFNNYNTTQTNN